MKLCVFNIKTSLFSITRFAGADRIKEILQVEDLPESMHPLLKQRVLPLDTLRNLEKQRKRLRDFLLRHATRNPLLGWVTATEKKDMIMEKIEEIRTEFLDAKADLLARYDTIRAEHLDELEAACGDFPRCAEFVEVVAAAQPDRAYVEKQVDFMFLKPRVVELDPEEENMVRNGIYDSVLADLAQSAKESLRLTGVKAQLRALDRMIEKLETLQYIDRRYGVVAGQLRSTVGTVPRGKKEKEYMADHVFRLTGALTVLMDPDGVALKIKHGESLFGAPTYMPNEDVQDHGIQQVGVDNEKPAIPVPQSAPNEDLEEDWEKATPEAVQPGPVPDVQNEDENNKEAGMAQTGMFAW